MMAETIKVGMADLNIAKDPIGLTTIGLGSCVGVCLYDNINRVVGLAHIMLPDSTIAKNNLNIAKYADTAIHELLSRMLKIGAKRELIKSKLAGGAQMFAFDNASDIIKVGEKNVKASTEILKQLNIPIIATDTGGNHGRTIEIFADGTLNIKMIGLGNKTI